MAYEKTVWKNNEAPKINATNLNKMENGIANAVATDSIARVNNVVSRNLANANNYLLGRINMSNGGIDEDNNWAYTKVKLKPNTQYTYQLTSTENQEYEVAQYQSNGTYIEGNFGNWTSGKQSYTFTTSNNTDYILIAWRNDLDHSNIQVEKGSTATPYTPYLNMQELEKNSIINNYSTGEQVIGKWIDGKPLYRKTYVETLSSKLEDNGSGTQYFIHPGITNVDDVVSMTGTIDNYQLPYIFKDANTSINYYNKNNNVIVLNIYKTYWTEGAKIKLTMEYTKSTD